MKRLIAIVALVLLIGSIPPTMARHRSVGAEDQVAVTPDNEPTVVDDGEGSPYQVGTTPEGECYEADGNVSQEAAEASLAATGYCGELVYNEDLDPTLEVISPPDQHVPNNIGPDVPNGNPIGSFDVVRTSLFGVPLGLTLCAPFCPNDPGGNQLHEAFYNTASETGVFDDSETTKEEQRNNRRNYGSAQIAAPNAAQAIQGQTGLWEMNGWANADATHTFVGFLEDKNGNPISDDRLNTIVGKADLPEGALPKVCGFTEDRALSTTKADNFCEGELKYFDNGDSTGRTDFRSYGDRCKSPTYTCNEASGPAWKMTPPAFLGSVASPYLGAAEDVLVPTGPVGENSPIANEVGFQFGDGDKYLTWHWVVAPAPLDCVAQEPVVKLDSDDAAAPYLAHDLDSYVPTTRLAGVDAPEPGPVEDYGQSLAEGPFDIASGAIDTLQDTAEVPPAVEDALDQAVATANQQVNDTNQLISDTQNDTIGETTKDFQIEPNANPALNPMADTSQTISGDGLSRSLDDPCQRAISSETPETVDPWVNLIDSTVTETATETTLYNNADPDQSPDNNPGPDRITTGGHVGLFTDKNDDGTYEKAPDNTYDSSDIQTTGAYPMLWNVKVADTDDGPEITGTGSCEFTDSATTKLSLDAKRMGYGPNTGLFQLIYLQEPTVADTNLAATEERTAYTGGNNIYLLASQSVKELWTPSIDPNGAGDSALDNRVDTAIAELRAYVNDNTEFPTDPQVVTPGEQFGLDSDFTHQCLAETGEFNSKISFTHDCQAINCKADTILTQYVFEIANEGGQLTDGEFIPSFSGLGDSTSDFEFGFGVHEWTDVDPFDGNPDRNDDTEQRPPT